MSVSSDNKRYENAVIVAIHQPTYLPWFGFFDKLLQADLFIILDDVQIQKTGGTWVNRTMVNQHGTAKWLTIPISRESGLQTIQNVAIADENWKQRHKNILRAAYGKTQHFDKEFDLLEQIYRLETRSLADFNLFAIQVIAKHLAIDFEHKIIRSSSLDNNQKSSARLLKLIRQAGGSEYLCGGGSTGYLDLELFKQQGITVKFQNFVEIERPQIGAQSFIRGLSIIDSLLTAGSDFTRKFVHKTAQ